MKVAAAFLFVLMFFLECQNPANTKMDVREFTTTTSCKYYEIIDTTIIDSGIISIDSISKKYIPYEWIDSTTCLDSVLFPDEFRDLRINNNVATFLGRPCSYTDSAEYVKLSGASGS